MEPNFLLFRANRSGFGEVTATSIFVGKEFPFPYIL
jgi:hypothetical protein